jgi:hypothetical protein
MTPKEQRYPQKKRPHRIVMGRTPRSKRRLCAWETSEKEPCTSALTTSPTAEKVEMKSPGIRTNAIAWTTWRIICVLDGLRKRNGLLEPEVLLCMRLTPMRSTCDGAGHKCPYRGSIYVPCDRYTAHREDPEL